MHSKLNGSKITRKLYRCLQYSLGYSFSFYPSSSLTYNHPISQYMTQYCTKNSEYTSADQITYRYREIGRLLLSSHQNTKCQAPTRREVAKELIFNKHLYLCSRPLEVVLLNNFYFFTCAAVNFEPC